MAISTSSIKYQVHSKDFEGFIAYDDSIKGKRPAVLIAHAWRGLDDFAKEKALELVGQGYVAFAADVYGIHKQVSTDEEALKMMLPLFEDRKLLQDRINGALKVLSRQEMVDSGKIAAIGYCFGGLTVLELLRSGALVKGIVAFHGVLADKLGNVKAKRPANAEHFYGSALFFHGNDDPLVSDKDIKNVLNELDEAEVDWQFHIFGHTSHAFTNPMANAPLEGLIYSPLAAKRAWDSLLNFLKERFI